MLMPMNNAGWEHFEHKADIGVRGFGSTLSEAFEQAALAMSAVITEPASLQADTAVSINCEASDYDILLYDWLNALIYEMATRKLLFGQFDVNIENGVLSAKALGETIDAERHQPTVEIKGATFTELAVCRQNGLWVAQCVIDV